MVRHTLASVRAEFASRGHTLLATEYKNNTTPLDYTCACGNGPCKIRVKELLRGRDACKPCARKKQEATTLKRYGVKYPAQAVNVKQKAEATMLQRYGVRHALQVPKFLAKAKATCLSTH
jgi:hypothetical protein